MRIEFHILAWPVPAEFRAMAFAMHGEMLGRAAPVDGILPVGVLSNGKALGFGLARASPEGGEILSLFVAPELWGNGVGTRLLEELERGLSRWGCDSVKIGYSTQSPSVPRLEKMLARRGWTAPTTRVILAQIGPVGDVPPPWMVRMRVPAGYEIFPWSELTPRDRAALEAVRDGIPPALWPCAGEDPLEPVCSVGVRCEAGLVGWMVCHRMAPEFIRFSQLHVRAPWRTPQLTLGLLAEALRRKQAAYGDEVVTTLAIQIDNERMLHLAERKFRPYARGWHEMRTAGKRLVN